MEFTFNNLPEPYRSRVEHALRAVGKSFPDSTWWRIRIELISVRHGFLLLIHSRSGTVASYIVDRMDADLKALLGRRLRVKTGRTPAGKGSRRPRAKAPARRRQPR